MNFSDVKSITILEGSVTKITVNNVDLWTANNNTVTFNTTSNNIMPTVNTTSPYSSQLPDTNTSPTMLLGDWLLNVYNSKNNTNYQSISNVYIIGIDVYNRSTSSSANISNRDVIKIGTTSNLSDGTSYNVLTAYTLPAGYYYHADVGNIHINLNSIINTNSRIFGAYYSYSSWGLSANRTLPIIGYTFEFEVA